MGCPWSEPLASLARPSELRLELEQQKSGLLELGLPVSNAVWLPGSYPELLLEAVRAESPTPFIVTGTHSAAEPRDLNPETCILLAALPTFLAHSGIESPRALVQRLTELAHSPRFALLLPRELSFEGVPLVFEYADELEDVREPDSLLARRLNELTAQLDDIRTARSDSLVSPIEQDHLRQAESSLALGRNRWFHALLPPEFHANPTLPARIHLSAFSAINSAATTIDLLRRPNTDPSIGWLEHALSKGEEADVFSVNTQLSRCSFSYSGSLAEFDYKPRKLNLVHPAATRCFTASLHDNTPASTEEMRALLCGEMPTLSEPPFITRSTVGLLSFRLKQTLSAAGLQLFKDYTFKAGIGAHLANATTGFSVEYWLEGPKPIATQTLLLVYELILGSPDAVAHSLRPLLCVGGIGESTEALDRPFSLGSEDVPGGLFGARLIDGITGFFLDLRLSKQISRLWALPLLSREGAFLGTSLVFELPAQRIYGDAKSLSLFLSIY